METETKPHQTKLKVKNEELWVFFATGVFITIYLLAGAGIFSYFEHETETKVLIAFENKTKEFQKKFNISSKNLTDIFMVYEEYRTKFVNGKVEVTRENHKWGFDGALHFAGTILTTIGFGALSPFSLEARIVVIFYGIFGCSMVVLFFNLFMNQFISLVTSLIRCYKLRILDKQPTEKCPNNCSERIKTEIKASKPSPKQVILAMSIITFIVTFSSAALYTAVENWKFADSLYFCFIAFSTIGLGDYVSGQESLSNGHADFFYKMSNGIIITLGCCCYYTLFNLIASFIDKFIKKSLVKLSIYKNKILSINKKTIKPVEVETIEIGDFTSVKSDDEYVYESENDDLGNLQTVQEFSKAFSKKESSWSLIGHQNMIPTKPISNQEREYKARRTTLFSLHSMPNVQQAHSCNQRSRSLAYSDGDESRTLAESTESWSRENNVGPMSVLQLNLDTQ